jgi:hypothetical protein
MMLRCSVAFHKLTWDEGRTPWQQDGERTRSDSLGNYGQSNQAHKISVSQAMFHA